MPSIAIGPFVAEYDYQAAEAPYFDPINGIGSDGCNEVIEPIAIFFDGFNIAVVIQYLEDEGLIFDNEQWKARVIEAVQAKIEADAEREEDERAESHHHRLGL